MKIETFACEICGIQKGAINKWWHATLLRKFNNAVSGVIITEWEQSEPKETDAHLCGAQCLFEYISKRVLEEKQ